eukprot:TRINITY_DN5247_c0_g1_i1.p1 TRINITY_DN5247_c0_g1~~TRINITY_DN5247_c0_g1_i1.p1  ORF type:complete len:318 (-),score=81.39 TRINITY_DN5247_c0_g1_i1:115-999(-)
MCIRDRYQRRVHGMTALLEQLLIYLRRRRQEFLRMQFVLNLENNALIVNILWDMLNSSIALLDIPFRHYTFLLYRELFLEFVPISHVDRTEDPVFTPDKDWLTHALNREPDKPTRERRVVELKRLSMNRKKRSAPRTRFVPYNYYVSTLKFASVDIDWSYMCKLALDSLISERHTDAIEKQLNEVSAQDRQEAEEDTMKIKLKRQATKTLRTIKRDLSHYSSMDQVRADVMATINEYKDKGLISPEEMEDYNNLIAALFDEAQDILNDRHLLHSLRNEKVKIKLKKEGDSIKNL